MSRIFIRIYYEDTDFSGFVYHANYLKYFERGRTEGLREAGHSHSTLLDIEDIIFAVRRMEVEFIKPARIDNLLEIRTDITLIKGARMNFRQEIWLKDTLLVGADVDCACLTRQGRPRRLPETVIKTLAKHTSDETDAE